MASRVEREERRRARAAWPSGQITETGDDAPGLYAEMDLHARLRAMRDRCVAQWRAAGGELIERPRGKCPAEVFTIADAKDLAGVGWLEAHDSALDGSPRSR